MNTAPDRRRVRVIPPNPARAAVLMCVMVAALWAIELVDLALPADLEANGILPRSVDGLDGILWAPLLHSDWSHLIANSLPLLVLGWLAMSGGPRLFVAVTATVWIVGGLGTWLVGADGTHIGASGVAFGWLVFLLVRGFFLRSYGQMFVALLLFFYWGGMLWGVLPGQTGISWEGHLFGALGGLLAAWLMSRRGRREPGPATSPGTLAG
ncbi:rhomboid family intramembrane serine protease [Saccharopolyspora erythraea]|uniref:rhomboid family intramembrane serine protease n=1 Tax=Saccharopolyspora erythraea TaxID=1836 RepID=UPI0032C21363